MKKNFNFSKLISLFVCVFILAGCEDKAVQVNVTDNVINNTKESMLEEAETDYEIPEMYPAIRVDKSGYDLNDKKEAIICAPNLPARYEIKDSSTGEVVYKGNIKKSDKQTEDGQPVGYADFTDFAVEGTYYIEADIVGTSDSFSVTADLYSRKLIEAVKELDALKCETCHSGSRQLENDANVTINISGGWHTGDKGQKDVVEGCLSVLDLLMAYEYFETSYSDSMGLYESGNGISDIVDLIKYESNWLMKMQNQSTGGVYTSVSLASLPDSGEERLVVVGETTKATAYFCATMARCGYVLGKSDSAYSQKCLKAANLAWKCLEANAGIVSKDQMYRAAVEMYRAGGNEGYNKVIEDYLKDNYNKPFENRLTLDAAISYLDTPRNTDKNYCGALMASFMDRSEIQSAASEAAIFYAEGADRKTGDILRDACELAMVDYIISSNAYMKTEKNYLHYIGGRNELSKNKFSFGNDPDSYAELILLLGRLIK